MPSKAGRSGTAVEKVLHPVRSSSPGKDQGADARRQEAGQEDHADHGPGDPSNLHEQEGTEDRAAEQGADRGEVARRTDDHGGLLRCVLLHEVHRPGGQATADGDHGASGPTTPPRASDRKAATAMPGNASGAATPFTDSPPEGSDCCLLGR